MSKSSAVNSVDWEMEEVVAEILNQSTTNTSKVIKFLHQGKSVPFIARYRKDHIGNMNPEVIHLIKEKVDDLKAVKESINKTVKQITKTGQLKPDIEAALRKSKTIEEVTFIAEPFKKKSAHSLANRARNNGLESIALKILNSPKEFPFMKEISPESRKAYKDDSDLLSGIQHIIADVISRKPEVTNEMESLVKRYQPYYEVKKSRTAEKSSEIHEKELRIYEQYFDFKMSVDRIKPHQILAINRGEANKILSVKIVLSEEIKLGYKRIVSGFIRESPPPFSDLIQQASAGAWDRLLAPHMMRTIRNEMKRQAELEALRVFGSNLRQVLMTAPVRDVPILGIDPGFTHGCKMAVISSSGDVLNTGKFYLKQKEKAASILQQLVQSFGVTTIALGDGMGSRDSATLLSHLIQQGVFSPLTVRFSIISESAASVYSASHTGLQDLPDLDISLRGAVSIARRMQDPLSEMVKMNPKNLGVGMYQHDLSEKQLLSTVNSILEECISFVGLDLNSAPPHLLNRVSGLNESQANAIVKYRQTNGQFINREQLKNVKGVGGITFEQCAGFVTVRGHPSHQLKSENALPNTVNVEMMETSSPESDDDAPMPSISSIRKRRLLFSSDDEEFQAPPLKQRKLTKKKSVSSAAGSRCYRSNPLDQTTIHPESYSIAERIIAELTFTPEQIGCEDLRSRCAQLLQSETELHRFVSGDVGIESIRYIVESLSRPLDFDIRQNHFGPLFRDCVRDVRDLKPNMVLIGRVINVTTFGAFVDIGVEVSAFLHLSKFPKFMNNNRVEEALKLGDVIVSEIEAVKENGKISLKGAKIVTDPNDLNSTLSSTKLEPSTSRFISKEENSIRNHCKPTSRTSLMDLEIGNRIEGVVKHMIKCAAFVDFGCECDGFAHVSQLPKMRDGTFGDEKHGVLKVGDRVSAILNDVKVDARRVSLRNLIIL